MSFTSQPVLVVGGGAFGTSIASLLASAGRLVKLWVRRSDLAQEINEKHTNQKHLPGLALDPRLEAVTSFDGVMPEVKTIILTVPAHQFRDVARLIGDHLTGDQLLIHAVKGLDPDDGHLMTEIIHDETCALKVGVLVGPAHAEELLKGTPAGALIAAKFSEIHDELGSLFQGTNLRVYTGRDIVGAEIGGAMQAVIAFVSGISDGMGLGENTRTLLITRGYSEMTRLGVALGARASTFGGLAGIGGLLTASHSSCSIARQAGERVGKGESIHELAKASTRIAEVMAIIQATYDRAMQLKLSLPIVEAAHEVVHNGTNLQHLKDELMAVKPNTDLARLQYQ